MAGGVNLFGEAGKHSPWMTWEQLVAADPEVIVDHALRLGCGPHGAGDALAHGSAGMAAAARRAKRPRPSDRRQPVFQSPRPAPGRVARNFGGTFCIRFEAVACIIDFRSGEACLKSQFLTPLGLLSELGPPPPNSLKNDLDRVETAHANPGNWRRNSRSCRTTGHALRVEGWALGDDRQGSRCARAPSPSRYRRTSRARR